MDRRSGTPTVSLSFLSPLSLSFEFALAVKFFGLLASLASNAIAGGGKGSSSFLAQYSPLSGSSRSVVAGISEACSLLRRRC